MDGTAVADITSVQQDSLSVLEVGLAAHSSSTPPHTPTHQQQVELLQQQLQQTPPGIVNTQQQQQQPPTFTPQSTTSSINTLASSSIPATFMKEAAGGGGGTSELEDPDIEEVLKALKGFDGSSAGDTLCDLNNFFNEVYTSLTSEEMNQQPTTSASSYTTISKPNPLTAIHTDIERQQHSMQKKIDFLIRRLRKLQARYMCKQTSEEIAGLFEWTARIASRGGSSMRTNQNPAMGDGILAPISVIAARPPAENWSLEKKNPIAASQMSNTLRKLEASVVQQQQQSIREHQNASSNLQSSLYAIKSQIRKSRKELENQMNSSGIAAISASGSNATTRNDNLILPTLDTNVTEELTHVAGLLQTEMREVQNAIDSDATASSSGGESADEMVTYNNPHQKSLSM